LPHDDSTVTRPSNGDLARGFGASTATFVVIASMVGTGILVSPGYMMASLGNHAAILGLWALGGVLALCGALCVAELAAAMPRVGGEYVYLREAYGRMPAFLAGWTSFLIGFSAPLAVAGHVAAGYLLRPFGLLDGNPNPQRTQQLAGAIIIVVVTIPNLLGHRSSAWAQNVTTVLKLALFGGLAVAGFVVAQPRTGSIGGGVPLGDVGVGAAASQLFFVMFAYSGWNSASYLAGEVRDPTRVLPRSLLIGTGAVTALYLALSVVFALTVPIAGVTVANAEQVPQLAVERLFGAGWGGAFSVAVGVTFLATVNAFVVSGPRIYYAMALDGLFPAIARRLSRRGGVPACAILAQSAWALVVLFLTDFDGLYQYTSFGLAVFSMLAVGAVYVLRRRQPDLPRPFRVPGYPFVPLLFLAVTAFSAVYAFRQWPGPSAWSLGSILLGIPVYGVWSRLRARRARAG
jgi:APA family basic amino acid/polyamine antiporter